MVDDDDASKPPSDNDKGCFNCEEPGHSVKECEIPKNQKKINANYQLFKQGKFKCKPLGTRAMNVQNVRKTKKGPDGAPLMLNKKNQWVTDQKALYLEKSKTKKEEAKSELMGLIGNLCQPTKTETENEATTASKPETTDPKILQIQAAVARMYS